MRKIINLFHLNILISIVLNQEKNRVNKELKKNMREFEDKVNEEYQKRHQHCENK